jgi:hypothetical protein
MIIENGGAMDNIRFNMYVTDNSAHCLKRVGVYEQKKCYR